MLNIAILIFLNQTLAGGGGDNSVIFFSICSLKRVKLVCGELKLCA